MLYRAQRKGEEVEALKRKPPNHSDFFEIKLAFSHLSQQRTVSHYGANPIQLSEIVAWLDLHEITDPIIRREYANHILALDAEWLKISRESSDGNTSARN